MVIMHKAVEGVTAPALERFLRRAGRAAGAPGPVNVLLTSSREIRGLNRSFRGRDKPTDVLSFPPPSGMAKELAGDIAISVDIAAANARRYGHTAAQELKILLLHGLLHLAGYDHESDGGEMARREDRLRKMLGLAGGLIRRTHVARPLAAANARRRKP